MTGNRKKAFRRLNEIAHKQYGVFTATQAISVGIDRTLHGYHLKVGNWLREHHGIYRLAHIQPTEHTGFKVWQFWSTNRAGQPQGVFSHQTALVIHGIQFLYPAKIHLTVPLNFRRSGKTPQPLHLHRANLFKGDIVEKDGFRCTSPLRTILSLAAADTLPRMVLRDALLQFLDQDKITQKEIERAPLRPSQRDMLNKLQRNARHK